MKKLIFSTFLLLNTIYSTLSEEEKYLHVYEDSSEYSKPFVIKNTDKDLVEALHTRYRRDLSSDRNNEGLKNITTRVINTFFFTLPLSKEKICVDLTIMFSVKGQQLIKSAPQKEASGS